MHVLPLKCVIKMKAEKLGMFPFNVVLMGNVFSIVEKICRYYEMTYVPLGMWSRLITRLIVFSKSQVTEVTKSLTSTSVFHILHWHAFIYTNVISCLGACRKS